MSENKSKLNYTYKPNKYKLKINFIDKNKTTKILPVVYFKVENGFLQIEDENGKCLGINSDLVETYTLKRMKGWLYIEFTYSKLINKVRKLGMDDILKGRETIYQGDMAYVAFFLIDKLIEMQEDVNELKRKVDNQ